MRADRVLAGVATSLAAVGLAACGSSGGGPSEPTAAKVESVHGQPRVVLSREAATRIGVRTAVVRPARARANLREIPYAALVYSPKGKTFTYVETAPLVYARTPVRVADLTRQDALVTSGPAPGSAVVTVGGQELYGTETGVQEPE